MVGRRVGWNRRFECRAGPPPPSPVCCPRGTCGGPVLSSLDRHLAHLARAQYGLFERAQAHEVGMTDRRLQARVGRGALERLSFAVFRVAGAPNNWHQRLLAPAWTGGSDCCVSHRSAAALHSFDGLRSNIVEVTHHQRRDYRRANGVIIHVTSTLEAVDRELCGPIPVTTAARTLIDLGAVVRLERLEEALDGALRDGRVDRFQLIKRHAEIRQRGRNGVGMLAGLLEARHAIAETPHSVLERRMLRILTGAGLPEPRCQARVERGDARAAFLDLAYPQIRLGIELDGQAWHATPRQRQRDNERQNDVVLSDWKILRFTFEDITHRPEHVAALVRRALVEGAARYPIAT